jgi:hypothetical protein
MRVVASPLITMIGMIFRQIVMMKVINVELSTSLL